MKTRDCMIKLYKSTHIYSILIFLLLFCLYLKNPFNPFLPSTGLSDSSIYYLMGKTIVDGDLLYIDSLDFKGPVLYLLNALGIIIGGTAGVWVLEFSFAVCGYLFLYKSFLFLFNKPISFCAVIVTIYMQMACFDGGNLTESWSLPFIFISFWVFMKYLYANQTMRWFEAALAGMFFACVMLIRPNNAVMWAAVIPVILVKGFMDKNFTSLFKQIGLFFCGFAFIMLAICLWMHASGILEAAYYSNIVIPFIYMDALTPFQKFFNGIMLLQSIYKTCLVLIVVPWLYYCMKDIKANSKNFLLFDIMTLSNWIFGIFSCMLSGHQFAHYAMICLLPLAMSVAAGMGRLYPERSQYTRKTLEKGIILLTISCIIVTGSLSATESTVRVIRTRQQPTNVPVVSENTGVTDFIVVWGNTASAHYYIDADRRPGTRHMINSILRFMPESVDEYIADIHMKKPEFFIIDNASAANPKEAGDALYAAIDFNKIRDYVIENYEYFPAPYEDSILFKLKR